MNSTRILAFLGLGALFSLSAACKVTVNGGGNSGGGGSGGGAQCLAEGPCCKDAPDDPCCTECTGTGGGGSGAVCGGIAGTPCAIDEYCDYPDDRCGESDGTGVCKKRPEGCPEPYMPVCACNGTVYGNLCEAQQAGQDVANYGSCTPPDDKLFPCGSEFCFEETDYCERTTSDVGSYPDSFQCKPLPAGCGGKADCACLAGEICGDMCEATGDGFRLTCPGG